MQPSLGNKLVGNEQRDAIHVAILPCKAYYNLNPGDHVKVFRRDNSSHCWAISAPKDKGHGIVDPFLTSKVIVGDLIYVCLYPNTVTDMRHHWQHKDIPDINVAEPDDNDDRAVLEKLLKECGYNSSVDAFLTEIGCDGWFCVGDDYVSEEMNDPYMKNKIIDLVNKILGTTFDCDDIYFSCSC